MSDVQRWNIKIVHTRNNDDGHTYWTEEKRCDHGDYILYADHIKYITDLCDDVETLQVQTQRLLERVAELQAQLTEAKKERVCRWEVDDDGFPPWATGCGHEFECIEDGLEENGFEYCPFCGGKVEVV